MIEHALLRPNPTFEYIVKKENKGKTLSKNDWNINCGVVSLEETIVNLEE